ncbi:MAG: hypothetical protein V4568_15770 [Pseudomonadota bacterium]
MEIAALVLVSSLIIGFLGRHKKFGFWGHFFCSLALTPCIGLVVLLASDSRKKDHKAIDRERLANAR